MNRIEKFDTTSQKIENPKDDKDVAKNKVIDINKKNHIKKDENNYYIENEDNSIKIEIKLLITEKTYPMEEIYNKDISEFVKHFSLENFKCTGIEYHKRTGKISKMLFEQIGN